MSALLRLACWTLTAPLVVILVTVAPSMAASNTVPPSGADEQTSGISANALKPSACSGLGLTTIVSGSGNIDGTSANDLILGSSGADKIKGNGGSDCILGGGGDDQIQGGGGGDVCIGGPGADTFAACATELQ